MPSQQASLEQLLDQLVADVKSVLRDKKTQTSESSEELETRVIKKKTFKPFLTELHGAPRCGKKRP